MLFLGGRNGPGPRIWGKTMHRLIVAAAAVAMVSAAAPAAAQSACPAGSSVAVMRLSKLVPGGSMDGVRQAIADHTKWYAGHGFARDKFMLAPVLLYDPATTKTSTAPDQFYTIHRYASNVGQDKHDAAWDAYVAEYGKNSTIVTTTLICMPD